MRRPLDDGWLQQVEPDVRKHHRGVALYVHRLRSLLRTLSRISVVGFLALYGLAHLPSAQAAIDIDDAQLTSGDVLPLMRWENIEGSPHWLEGVPLHQHKPSRWHVADLAAGDHVTLQLPAGRILRLAAIASDCLSNDVNIWTSNGSGLYRPLPLGQVEQDGSLLVALDEHSDALVRIERTADNGQPLCVAFFLARSIVPPDAWRYTCPLAGGDQTALLESDDDLFASDAQPYSWLPARGTAKWTIAGPRRLRLETRLAYAPNEARSRQAYRVHLAMTPGLPGTFELETTCDRGLRGEQGVATPTVGLSRVVYWNVPAGLHRIQLSASDPIWLRATATDELPAIGSSGPSFNYPSDQNATIWDLSSIEDPLQYHVREGLAMQRERALLRARDNRYAHGPLDAWQFRAQLARRYPLSRDLLREAEAALTIHSRFRPLLPATSSGPLEFRAGRFVERRLDLSRNATKPIQQSFTIAKGQLDDALQSVLSGQFVKLSPGGYLDYGLVSSETASRIRCVVDQETLTENAELMLQVDQGVAFPLRYLPPQTEQEISRLWSNGDAALSALDSNAHRALPPTLRGSFDAKRPAGPWRDVATTEFHLPRGARRLRITNSSDHDCWLSLQQTESRPYRLSETDWHQHVACINDWPSVFRSILKREPLPSTGDASLEELRNHYEPLVAELERRQNAFARGVAQPESAQYLSLSASEAQRLLTTARQLSSEKQWVPALTAWTQLTHSANPDVRREAVVDRIETLFAAGERYLAEQELKGRFLYDADANVRDMAYERLLEEYRSLDQVRKLRNLVAAGALQKPSLDRLLALAEQQMADDEADDALAILLGLSGPDQPLDLLCHAALAAHWWQTAEDAITASDDSEAANYWRGRWFLQQGDVEAALPLFEQAGKAGSTWAHHIQQATQIETELGSPREAHRWQAILDWEAWEMQHPGPRVWREELDLVVKAAGTDRLETSDGRADSDHFVAHPTEPFELVVQGPIQLKLHARPLRAGTATTPLNDLLIVNGQGKRWLWRVADNAPTADLRSTGFANCTIGSLETWEVHLGPGRHHLQITPDHHTMLLQAFVLRPQVRIPILPRLTPATVDAAMERTSLAFLPEKGCVRLVSSVTDSRDCVTLPILPLQASAPPTEEATSAVSDASCITHLESESRARATLRLGVHEPAARTVLLEWTDRVSPKDHLEEQAEILSRYAESNDPRWNRLPIEKVSTAWMGAISAQRDWKRLRNIRTSDDPAALGQLVNILLYRVQQQPKDQMYVIARLVQLAEQFPNRTFLQDVVKSLEVSGGWMPFREVQESAGVRRVRVIGPIASNQSARTRFALMDNAADDPFNATHLLANSGPTTIQLERTAVTDLAIAIRPLRGQFEPRESQSWQLLLDGQPLKTLVCTGNDLEITDSIHLSAGPHTLTIQAPEDTTENQYAAAIVAQLLPAGKLEVLPELEREEAGQRLTYVATPSQPIRFQPRGPALFRVEQLTLDGTVVNVQKMAVTDSVVADVELTASEGQNQAYFRILEHQLAPLAKKPAAASPVDDRLSSPEELPLPEEPQPIPLAFTPTPVEEIIVESNQADVVVASYEAPDNGPLGAIATLRTLSPDAAVTLIPTADAIPLGSHEDGTWGWTAGGTTRRPVDEGRNQGAPDQFFQLGVNYQQYNDELDRYTRTQGVARLRDESGPSFGLIHERWSPLTGIGERSDAFDGMPAWVQSVADHVRLDQEWYTYLQQPADALPGHDESLEASVGTRQRLYVRRDVRPDLYHTPSIAWFGRWLSMDEVSYERGRVDQDIFTQYKADHRMGLQLSDLWMYEPESVIRWFFRPAVTTNEDHNPFAPDHVSMQTGLSTLLDTLYLGISYRCTAFLADADRKNSSTQHLVSFDATLDRWQHAGHRYELDVAVRHVIDQNQTSAMLNLTLFRSHGRGYRDHAPGEVDFRRERERRAFGTWQRSELGW